MDLNYAWKIICIALSLTIFSCTEDVDFSPGPNLIDEYYPIAEGDVKTYAVDSITYDYDGLLQQIVIDTQQYFIREVVEGTIQMGNEPWWRVGIYRSDEPDRNFKLTEYAYLRNTNNQLLRKEGNLIFIPLGSPMELFTEWDGTANFNPDQAQFFIRGEVVAPYVDWNYILLKKWDTYEVLDRTYDNVLQINQKDTAAIQTDNGQTIDPVNQLFYTLANEFYAPGVGLIRKEVYHLTSICASSNVQEYESFCDSTTIFANAERGFVFHKMLISSE